MTPSVDCVTVATCDDECVTLDEYDALLREWLRELLRESETGKRELARRASTPEKEIHSSDLTNATNNKRNVSKEMLVGLTRAAEQKLSQTFQQLASVADRYERGLLKLTIPLIKPDITVRPQDAGKTQAVATAMSKRSAAKKKKNKPAQQESQSEEREGISSRKS